MDRANFTPPHLGIRRCTVFHVDLSWDGGGDGATARTGQVQGGENVKREEGEASVNREVGEESVKPEAGKAGRDRDRERPSRGGAKRG